MYILHFLWVKKRKNGYKQASMRGKFIFEKNLSINKVIYKNVQRKRSDKVFGLLFCIWNELKVEKAYVRYVKFMIISLPY